MSSGKEQEAEQAEVVYYVLQNHTFLQCFSQIASNKKTKQPKGWEETSQAALSQGMGAIDNKSGYTKPA